MSKRSIRFPDDLEQAIENEAERTDRSFSYVVVKACRTTYTAPLTADPHGSDRASRTIPTHPRVTRSPTLDRFAGPRKDHP
jgi:hypothetical protein